MLPFVAVGDVRIFLQGYKHQKAYMIAEGPMSLTTRNMLKLLYDRKCGVIIMLSRLQENGKVRKIMGGSKIW